MSNTFNIGRFWKYFKWDLRNAKNNFGLSMLIAASLPLFLFFIAELFSLIFSGEFVETGLGTQIPAMLVGNCIIFLSMPTKVYGKLTDKRQGSDWLMLPASSTEKTVSMILMGCIVAPVCWFVVFNAWDFLLSWIFPGHYGNAVLLNLPLDNLFNLGNPGGVVDMNVQFNMPLAIFMSWCENILIFTLGAICFKKSKAAKTILLYFAFSMLLSTVITTFVGINAGGFGFTESAMEQMDFAKFFGTATRWAWVIGWTFVAGLIAAIYYRVRTIRH